MPCFWLSSVANSKEEVIPNGTLNTVNTAELVSASLKLRSLVSR